MISKLESQAYMMDILTGLNTRQVTPYDLILGSQFDFSMIFCKKNMLYICKCWNKIEISYEKPYSNIPFIKSA